ncbi:MAG: fructosamine kinase family protein [Chloroflexi bacterium]|jgi:fructosamine-3-kinase|nr:fructosamine kinase family protein [Chloroflexota bacterium]
MLRERLRERLGAGVRRLDALHGGCIGQVYRAELEDGQRVVVKVDDSPDPRLDVEAYMLRYLAEHSDLPVPGVLFAAPDLLIMSYIPGDSRLGREEQAHAAELLAALHGVRADRFGLERDTLIGGLPQPNPWRDSWLAFFAEQRLGYMAREAERAGRLPTALRQRVERLAAALPRWLQEPAHPSLIHGDMWTTNILARNGRITGFLDPAIYYADPEVELAFSTLFGTFGEPFFRRYQELRPLQPGFFEERRDLYNVYPLLVHVRLFGGSYVASVDQTLRRFGF